MAILPSDIWPIENLTDFKVHFARWNGKAQPLDVWVTTETGGEAGRLTRPFSSAKDSGSASS